MRTAWLPIIVLQVAAVPALAADPSGDWMVSEKTAVIHVAPCVAPGAPAAPASASAGAAPVCGQIVWTKGPAGVDDKNPDPAKRGHSVIGLQILNDMKPTTTANRWEGQIYNAENGKTYDGSITLENQATLRIQGCVLGFLCGGEAWTRAKCEPAKGAAAPNRRTTQAATPVAMASCREERPGEAAGTR